MTVCITMTEVSSSSLCAPQGSSDPEEGSSRRGSPSSDRRAERSLEESRKLILEWADELRHVDKVRGQSDSSGAGGR